MSTSKLMHDFTSQPEAFGFLASLPPDNITLNSANRETDHSLIFRLAFVQLLMPLYTQSSLFFIPELLLVMQLPLYKVLMEG